MSNTKYHNFNNYY